MVTRTGAGLEVPVMLEHLMKGPAKKLRMKWAAFLRAKPVTRRLFRIREGVLPILYPRHCPVCGRILSMGHLICEGCRASLPWIRDPACFLCGKPVSDPEQELCHDCRSFPKSFRQGVSLLLYNEVTRPVIADFKYHNKRILARYFAEELSAGPLTRIHLHRPAILVPVPVHKNKERARGYNQAALLARDLSVLTGLSCLPDLLIRTSDTTPQKTLSPQARLDNLKNAFSVNPDYAGLNRTTASLLLVDDIYTTGATLEICTRVLMAAGFKDICICTICTGVARD